MGRNIQIIEHIYEELMKSDLSDDIGLLSGTSGIALFIAYYDSIINKQNSINPRIIDILEHNMRQINSGYWLHTLCSGISGFGWICEHLRKIGFLDIEDIEFLDDLDHFLFKQMIIDMKYGNYDYMHGALGVGTYFLSRFYKREIHKYVAELLVELEQSAILCGNGGIKWISELNKDTGKRGCNISLSHGMSSIAAFLIQLYQMNFETKRVEDLLSKTIVHILDQVNYTEGKDSYFPTYSKENNLDYNSRLGWCYGDLGIACILWRAGIILKNKEWEDFAIYVLYHNADRLDLHDNFIYDAGLCHGSAGIAYIFEYIYLNTYIQKFRDTADYWLKVTLEMDKYTDGLAGFKAWRTEKFGGPVKADSLLEGVAGIGLSILSHSVGRKTAWSESLMLY